MNHNDYKALLDKMLTGLKEMAHIYAPDNKTFAYADVLNDPTLAVQKIEYIFMYGDILQDKAGHPRFHHAPFIAGDWVVGASQSFAKELARPLVLEFYVFGEDDDNPAFVMYISYPEIRMKDAVKHVYLFLTTGDLPNVNNAPIH